MARLSTRLFDLRGWPSQCAVCRAWPAHAVCTACVARFAPLRARCDRCALPVTPGVRRCGACLSNPPPLDACLAAVGFEWPWAGLIARMKFQQDIGLAGALATLLRRTPGVAEVLAQADWLVPMPLAPARLAERGYNPALLLARRLPPARCLTDGLRRVRDTPPQRGLTRAERQRNVRGAFAVHGPHAAALRDQRVVLIDDVMTTGASLHEAARALRAAGVAHITALTLARTELPP